MFESDHVSLPEAELACVLRLEVVEGLTGGLVQRGGSGAGRVAVGGGHAGVEARAELRGMVCGSPRRRAARRYQVPAGDVAGNTNSQSSLQSLSVSQVVRTHSQSLSGVLR